MSVFSRMLRDGGSPKSGSWEAAERALDELLGPACNGICVMGSEVLDGGVGVAIPHPDCELHGGRMPGQWCSTCGTTVPVVDEFDEQLGYEEQARAIHVARLDCGHDNVTGKNRTRP